MASDESVQRHKDAARSYLLVFLRQVAPGSAIRVGVEWRFLKEKALGNEGFGDESLRQRIPAVLSFLWLRTRACRGTKTLRARISLFFLDKWLQEAPFGSELNNRAPCPSAAGAWGGQVGVGSKSRA